MFKFLSMIFLISLFANLAFAGESKLQTTWSFDNNTWKSYQYDLRGILLVEFKKTNGLYTSSYNYKYLDKNNKQRYPKTGVGEETLDSDDCPELLGIVNKYVLFKYKKNDYNYYAVFKLTHEGLVKCGKKAVNATYQSQSGNIFRNGVRIYFSYMENEKQYSILEIYNLKLMKQKKRIEGNGDSCYINDMDMGSLAKRWSVFTKDVNENATISIYR